MPYFQFLFRGANAHFIYFRILVRPKGYVVGVLLFYLTSSHSEKQLGFASINGVVVNIRPVNESYSIGDSLACYHIIDFLKETLLGGLPA